MGDLVNLSDHRRAKASACHEGVRFSFDLASPYTYLAAERVHRMFGEVQWNCVVAEHPAPAPQAHVTELRAAALRMPLVWPEASVGVLAAAPRVATYAASKGRGAEFVLAASRLAFCGGFDLADPEILAEAAAAAGLPLDDCLAVASDSSLDEGLRAEGRRLMARGAQSLPVLEVGRLMFCGEDRIAEAAAAARTAAPAFGRAFRPA